MAAPIYTTMKSVEVRLRGKVAFQTGVQPSQREMPYDLAEELVADAESAVEQELRGRYAIPFRSIRSKTWGGLPDHTRRAIRTLVDCKSVIFILNESFGMGSHISADPYMQMQKDKYDELLRRLLGQDLEASELNDRRFKYTPPLEDLMLAPTNVSDDGMRGRLIDANQRTTHDLSQGAQYAVTHVNDPSIGLFPFGGRRGIR